MSRIGVLGLGAAMLLSLGLVWVLGGPGHAGALAGLSDSGPGAAAGLVWILLVPAVCTLVPALLMTAAAEALHGVWAARGPHGTVLGLGSRSRPSDT